MAKSNSIRRRHRSNSTPSSPPPPPPPSSSPPAPLPRTRVHTLFNYAKSLATILVPILAGILMASCARNDRLTVQLFVFTTIALIAVLLRVFISILSRKDNTPVQLPKLYNTDGTVTNPEPMNVMEHDKKIATYFASELPLLAMAAIWMYLWTNWNMSLLIYSIYVAYRFLYHPLFRAHIWQEHDIPEVERPFGGVPLFKETDASGVVVVRGLPHFNQLLENAGESALVVVDCSAVWCAPCRTMAPIFKQFAQEFSPNVKFLSVDVDTSRDVAEFLNITSVPSFVFYRDSEKLHLLRGASPKTLRSAIEQNMQTD